MHCWLVKSKQNLILSNPPKIPVTLVIGEKKSTFGRFKDVICSTIFIFNFREQYIQISPT